MAPVHEESKSEDEHEEQRGIPDNYKAMVVRRK